MVDADTLAVGLELERYSRADVSEWVDADVLRHQRLPDALLELTTLAHRETEEIVKLLRALSTSDEARLWRIAVTMIAEDYRGGACALEPTVERLVTAGRRYGAYETPAAGELYFLEDGVSLASDGTWGTLEDVREHLEAFLAEYALRDEG
jgi:hypothetical protein